MTRARWPGECVLCGQPIRLGDSIVQRPGGWAHAVCAARGKE